MAVCRPASQFCCGCSVKFGVNLILIVHLIECLWVTIMTGVFIIGRNTFMIEYAFSDVGMQIAFACFALAGIPIILVGLWGARNGVEACLRVYLFYMILNFLLDTIYSVYHFGYHHTCDDLPGIMAQQGRAWACGMARVFDIGSLLVMLAIPAYLIHIVHSFCEDMAEGGSGPDLSGLTSVSKRKQPFAADPYSSVLGLTSYSEYGGVGGGQPILDGTYHEMAYPPPQSVYHWNK